MQNLIIRTYVSLPYRNAMKFVVVQTENTW